MTTWSLAVGICVRQLLLNGLIGGGKEDHFAICSLCHCLHRLQVPNLHGRRAAQDVRSLPHQFGALYLGARGDDFALSDTLSLRSHAEGVLQLVGEDDVFDEHAFNLYAPAGCNVFDDFANRLSDLFAALDDVLENTSADDVAECSLGALDEGLADVGDAEGGFVRRGDVVVNDGGQGESHVIFGDTGLFRDLCHSKERILVFLLKMRRERWHWKNETYRQSESSRQPGSASLIAG